MAGELVNICVLWGDLNTKFDNLKMSKLKAENLFQFLHRYVINVWSRQIMDACDTNLLSLSTWFLKLKIFEKFEEWTHENSQRIIFVSKDFFRLSVTKFTYCVPTCLIKFLHTVDIFLNICFRLYPIISVFRKGVMSFFLKL